MDGSSCLSEACKLGILQSPVAVVLEGQVLASQTGSTAVGCSFGTVDGSSLLSERVVSSILFYSGETGTISTAQS